jgi:hypothetical protein
MFEPSCPRRMLAFERDVLEPVRRYLGRERIQVPAVGTWNVNTDRGLCRLELELDAADLVHNLQTDRAAAPTFLVCLSYWLQQTLRAWVGCRLAIRGNPPSGEAAQRHWKRSLFILDQFERTLGKRFELETSEHWQWPATPILNVPRTARAAGSTSAGRPEHMVEMFLCSDERPAREFCMPIEAFQRQLPIGLFDGAVKNAKRWTPGGKSQIDAWARSVDGSTVHLFEIKAGRNMPLGIIPEALYYTRLLHYARVGLDDGRKILGDSIALDSIRSCQRLQMWLVAPSFHPLLFNRNRSPLEWLNDGMRQDGVELRIMPFEEGQREPWSRWSTEWQWPAPVDRWS